MKIRSLFLGLILAATLSPATASYDGFATSVGLRGTFSSTYTYPFTLVAWVNCSATGWADTTNDTLVDWNDGIISDADSAMLLKGGGAADQVKARAQDTNTSGTGQAVQTFTDGTYDGLWVPVVARYTSAIDRHACIESSSNCTQNTTSRAITALDVLSVGNDATLVGLWLQNCQIAEVAVFDVALTNGEIDNLQSSSETGPTPCSVRSGDCIGYWSLDTDQATHADEGPNSGPSLSEIGAVTFNADHPTITSGGVVPILINQARRRKQ